MPCTTYFGVACACRWWSSPSWRKSSVGCTLCAPPPAATTPCPSPPPAACSRSGLVARENWAAARQKVGGSSLRGLRVRLLEQTRCSRLPVQAPACCHLQQQAPTTPPPHRRPSCRPSGAPPHQPPVAPGHRPGGSGREPQRGADGRRRGADVGPRQVRGAGPWRRRKPQRAAACARTGGGARRPAGVRTRPHRAAGGWRRRPHLGEVRNASQYMLYSTVQTTKQASKGLSGDCVLRRGWAVPGL